MIENFKKIQSDPYYYIDMDGNVYDADLNILKPYIGPRGTYLVTLRKSLSMIKNRGDNKKNCVVARLLLEHFVRKPVKNEVVMFIDGNLLNHELSNLRWGKRNEVNSTKFDDETILNIKDKLSQGISQAKIAREFHISNTHVSKINRGLTRTYLNNT